MTILLSDSVKEIDNFLKDDLSLIDKAGKEIAYEVNKLLDKKGKILALASKGNNGADGLAALKYLSLQGHEISVFIVDELNEYGNTYKKELEDKGLITLKSLDGLSSFDIVLDGIYGIGFRGQLREEIEETIKIVNKEARYIVSIDIPTGAYPDTGKLGETYIKADKTIVLQNMKMANVLYPAREICGDIIVKDIGIPNYVTEKFSRDYQYLNKMRKIFKKREKDSHKGDYGKLGIIAGSEGMVGAAIMAADASLLTGAGYVFQISPRGLKNAFEANILETVKKYLGDDSDQYFKEEDASDLLPLIKDLDAIVIGPGLSNRETTRAFVRKIVKGLENTDIKIILDADGINSFENFEDSLPRKNLLITPHYGEYLRLRKESDNDRIKDSQYYGNRGIVTVLKGGSTITAYKDKLSVNGTGNPGMATPGSGDVLAGLIGALSLRMDLYDAGRYGALIHGLAGDRASEQKGEESLLARNLLEMLPLVIREGKEK